MLQKVKNIFGSSPKVEHGCIQHGCIQPNTDIFKPKLPYECSLNGFTGPTRIRIVGIVNPKTDRFTVDLCDSEGEILFHFNPRFKENCIVFNSTKSGGKWQNEERFQGMPFQHGKSFTLDLIVNNDFAPQEEEIRVLLNGRLEIHAADDEPFSTRLGDSLSDVKSLKIGGDIQLHSVSVCSHEECADNDEDKVQNLTTPMMPDMEFGSNSIRTCSHPECVNTNNGRSLMTTRMMGDPEFGSHSISVCSHEACAGDDEDCAEECDDDKIQKMAARMMANTNFGHMKNKNW